MTGDTQECACTDELDPPCVHCDRQATESLAAENMRLRRALIEAERALCSALLDCGWLDTKNHAAVRSIDVALGRRAS